MSWSTRCLMDHMVDALTLINVINSLRDDSSCVRFPLFQKIKRGVLASRKRVWFPDRGVGLVLLQPS